MILPLHTRVATGLLAGLRARGVSALGMKPVASGCRHAPSGLRNEDAEAVARESLRIAAGICIYTNDEISLVTLP